MEFIKIPSVLYCQRSPIVLNVSTSAILAVLAGFFEGLAADFLANRELVNASEVRFKSAGNQ